MKVYVDTDERYPDFILMSEGDHYTEEVEVDEATLRRWQEAESAYDQRHSEIAEALRLARERKKASE